MSDNIEQSIAIEQASRWLQAWAEDQAYIASKQPVASERAARFRSRAEALLDAARDIQTSDIWNLCGFMRADGTYPEAQL